MAEFPSVDWFHAVRSVFNEHDEYHGAGGGACDTRFGVVVEDDVYALTMAGLRCVDAVSISADELPQLDFYLLMSRADWRVMLENIRDNGRAALDQTLNTIDLDREEGLAHSAAEDQYKQDLFFRYNQTLQHFFDASSRVETSFSDSD